ncbi:MAG: hypothetical protein IJL33_04915, partial [Ruminococcus sp.]|nr:hypothetical protein [Ruminococcus sp.]
DIPFARFKIGHTPRKLPAIPTATYRFNAYIRAVSAHFSALNVINYITYIGINQQFEEIVIVNF